MRTEAVNAAIFHAHGDYATARAIFHDQIKCKIFNEKRRVITQALAIQSVEHGMACAIGRGTGALHGRAFAHVHHMTAKGALINLAVLSA